jgi:beta-glucosidase
VKGDEVVQVYIKDLASKKIQPLKKLRDFQRISLAPGETRTLVFERIIRSGWLNPVNSRSR